MSSILSGPSAAPTAAIGNVVVASQSPDVDAAQAAATLAAEIDLVRRELYLGYWQEVAETLDRVRKRFAKAAESATAWSLSDSTKLRLMRAISYALQGRAEDTRDTPADWLFRRANDLFAQVASTTGASELSDEERTDWAVTLAHLGDFDAAVEMLPEIAPDDDAAQADVICEFGRAYAKAGLMGDALRYLEHAVSLDPNDPRTQDELGAVLSAIGESRRAAAAFRAAAIVLERGGRFHEALAQIESALVADPALVDNHVMKIQLLRALGSDETAMAHVETALVSAPDSHGLLREQLLLLVSLHRYEEALEVAERGSRTTDGSNDLELLRVSALVGLRKLPEALDAARAAADAEPLKPEVHMTLAHVFRAAGDEDDALAVIERAIELNRWDADAHVMRASILRRAERLDEAINAAEEAVNLAPDEASANLELGISLAAAGRWEEALSALKTASSARPGDPWPLAVLSLVQANLGHPDEAIKGLRRAIRTPDVDLIWARDELVELLLPDLPEERLERADEARQIVEETIAIAPVDSPARDRARRLMLRGEALRVLGEYDEALASLRDAAELDPESPDIIGTMGQVLHSLGRWHEAVEALNRATEMGTPSLWIVLALVEVLAEQHPRAAIEAIANTQDRGLDREAAAFLLDVLLREAPNAVGALDDVLARRGAWDAGVTVRAVHAVALEQREDYERLFAALEHVRQRDPEWVAARHAQLGLLRALGRTADALGLIDQTLALDPRDEPSLRAKYELLAATRTDDEAEQFLRQVIDQEGTAVWAFEALGRMLSEDGRDEDALGLFNHVLGRTGDESIVAAAVGILMRTDRAEEALAVVRRALARKPDSVWLRTKLAEQLWMADRNEEALRAIQRSLELDPFNPAAHELGGALLADLGRPMDALIAFDHVPRQTTLQPWAMVRRGYCLTEIGEFEEALPNLDAAIEVYAGHRWLLGLRAWACQHAGRLDRALADYEALLRADNGDIWAEKGIATCLSLIDGRRDEAPPRFRAVLNHLEGESTLPASDRFGIAGWCLYRLGELDDAVAALSRAIAADPLSAAAQLDLGLAMLCRSDGRKARAEYERGVELARNAGPRGASQLRVALGDLEHAQRERPGIAADKTVVKVHSRLREATDNARETNARRRDGDEVESTDATALSTEEHAILAGD